MLRLLTGALNHRLLALRPPALSLPSLANVVCVTHHGQSIRGAGLGAALLMMGRAMDPTPESDN